MNSASSLPYGIRIQVAPDMPSDMAILTPNPDLLWALRILYKFDRPLFERALEANAEAGKLAVLTNIGGQP